MMISIFASFRGDDVYTVSSRSYRTWEYSSSIKGREPTSVPGRLAVAAPLATPHPRASFNGIPRVNAQTKPPTIESPAPIGFFSWIFGLWVNHVPSEVCDNAPALPMETTTFCAPILRISAAAVAISEGVSIDNPVRARASSALGLTRYGFSAQPNFKDSPEVSRMA